MSKQSDLVNITQGDADINGGTIDGTVIGGSTPAAISGTTGTFSENLTISGSARRITGDMSDSTHANRLAFQSSTVNGSTSPFFLPNGTATIASAVFSNASDPTNSSFFQIGIDGSNRAFINSGSLGTGTALPLAIITDLSERMRITSTGSVGIGTSSPSAKLEVSGADDTNLLVVGHGDTDFAVYTDGTVGEVRLKAEDGSGGNFSKFMTFYTQPSGTAADERMRIDASGNVGIGTSSISGKFSVNGTMYAGPGSVSNVAYGFYPAGTYGSTGMFAPAANTVAFATSGGERVRITSSGNVGIGTSSPATKLTVGPLGVFRLQTGSATMDCTPTVGAIDSFVWNTSTSNNPYIWSQGGTERMRIDASGNVGIGVSPSTAYLEMAPNAAWGAGIRFGGNGNVSDTTYANICTTNGNIHIDPRVGSYGTYLNWYSGTGGVHVGNASAAGYGQILAATFTTISDYRMKEDVQPMVGVVDRLMALNPVNFAWKADGTRVDGFIAHETQEVVPEAVVGEKDDVNADGDPVYQGIDHGKLVPLLTAALQEALTEIADLKARVAALET